MPTNVPSGSFTVFEDEIYGDNPAFFWDWVTCNFVNEGTILSNYAAFDSWNGAGLLENRGTVHVYVDTADFAYGLYSENSSPAILNTGLWWVEGVNVWGVYTFSVSGAVTNSGDWIVDGSNFAIGIYLNNGGSVVNEGNIIVSAGGQGTGIRMDRDGVIDNSGLIQVTGSVSYGIRVAEAYDVGGPNIINSGTITASIAIFADVNGSLTPTIHLLNTGTINGRLDLQRNPDTVDNQGVINGDVFGDLGNDLVDTTLGVINGTVYLGDGNDEFRGGAQASRVLGGTGDDLLTGGAGDEEFYGEMGADTIQGGAGADYISGGTGPDTIDAGDGNDVIDGGTGTDNINGGAGFDLAVYESATSAVIVSLLLQGVAQNTGGAGTDTLISIEDLAGSAYDDTLIGDGNGNYLFGLGGADVLNGGDDVDVAGYFIASSAATWHRNVDGTWTVTAGADGTDTLTNVEFLSFTDRDVFLDRASRTFSGNGTSDILFRRADGIMASWEVTGTSITSAAFLPTAGPEWSVLGVGDISGDGKDDVIWQRNDGLVYSWIMNGGAVSAAIAHTGIGNQWTFLGVGDFNGDLTDDLAWQRNDGLVYIWNMQNSAIQSASAVTGLGAEWQIAGFGDFNSDGRDDFLWRNANTGQTVIWHMNGAAIQSSGATSTQAGLDWAVVGVGDTNGDGRDDIIVQRQSDGMIAVWAMDGTNVMSATNVAAANPADWTVRQIGDYNGDGRDDILWQHDNGLVYVWLLNGSTIIGSGGLSGIGGEWSII